MAECPECKKLGFNLPMKKEGHSYVCRLCGYKELRDVPKKSI